MDEKSLKTLLESTGMKVAYHSFTAPPPPPYLLYLFDNSDNLGADNKVYHKDNSWNIELYTKKKDPAAEAKVEAVLDAAEIYWEKTETYLQSEGLFEVLYEI